MTTKKSSKKLKGLMCQSGAATAVCAVGDPRSVIVPRLRSERTSSLLVDSPRFMKNSIITTTSAKYSRLGESNNYSRMRFLPPASANRSVVVSSIKKQENNFNNSNNNNNQEYYDRPKLHMQKPLAPSMASADQVFQVVVMRVSLHCQGCASKVKKHLSKMEGVTSFSIDLETKRVTVMGHVSPVGVLESISKVKPAEFWPC